MLRRWSKWLIVLSIAVLVGLSVAFSATYSHQVGLARTGYMTPTHLLTAAARLRPRLLAGQLPGRSPRAASSGSSWSALVGLAGMAWISKEWYADRLFLVTGGYALYGAFACLLIGHCSCRGKPAGRHQPDPVAGSRWCSSARSPTRPTSCTSSSSSASLRAYPTMDVDPDDGARHRADHRHLRRLLLLHRPPDPPQGLGRRGRSPDRQPADAPDSGAGPPSPAESATGAVFGVLVIAVVAAAGAVLGGDSWTGAGIVLTIGAVLAQIVARPALR